MSRYLVRRIFSLFFLAWAATSLAFFMIHLVPGDPVAYLLGFRADREDIQRVRNELNLEKPLGSQYLDFQKRLVRLDLGQSIFNGKGVLENIFIYFPNTVFLSLGAMAISLLVSFLLGVLSAFSPDSFLDSLVTALSSLGLALPNFILGPLLIILFSLNLGWFPVSGSEGIRCLVLPCLTLGLSMSASFTRIIRVAVGMELARPYVLLARSKGLSGRRIFFKHILKNALPLIITTAGMQMGALLTGTIITETIFSWPGIGCLLIKSVRRRDYPQVQGLVMFITLVYLLVNLLVDLSYPLVNPKLRNEIRHK